LAGYGEQAPERILRGRTSRNREDEGPGSRSWTRAVFTPAKPASEIKITRPFQMDPNASGSLVYRIDPLAPAAEILKEGDIVLEVEGVPIADDGTVEFRDDERVEFTHLVRGCRLRTSPWVRWNEATYCIHSP